MKDCSNRDMLLFSFVPVQIGKSTILSEYDVLPSMKDIVERYSMNMAGAGIIPVPGIDISLITPVGVSMTIALAKQARHSIPTDIAKKIFTNVTLSENLVKKYTLAYILRFIPGIGRTVTTNDAAYKKILIETYGKALSKFFLQVEEIHKVGITVDIIIELMGTEMGFKTSTEYVISK